MRALMGSRCSCFSVFAMWAMKLRSFIRRAAVCRTEDRGCSQRRQSGLNLGVVDQGKKKSIFFQGNSIFPWNFPQKFDFPGKNFRLPIQNSYLRPQLDKLFYFSSKVTTFEHTYCAR